MGGSNATESDKTTSKKKKKADDDEQPEQPPPSVPEGWTRCHAYLRKKHRYCRQLTLQDSIYCGNHQELELEGDTTRATVNKASNSKKRKRIPCPLDQSHSIYEDMVERHLKICPKAKLQRQQEGQPYYQTNINGGGHGTMGKTTNGNSSSNNNNSPQDRLARAQAFARRVLFVHQRLFGSEATNTTSNPNNMEDTLCNLTLSDIESALPLQDLSPGELEAGLAEAIESYHIRSGGPKHLQQQASLLGHLRRISSAKGDGSDDTTTLLLELGAGRGMLGLVAAGAFAASSSETNTNTNTCSSNNNHVDLIMIERAGTRSKADTILRNHTSDLEGRCIKVEDVRDWERIQCDLAHVHMPTVLAAHNEKTAPQANSQGTSSSSASSLPTSSRPADGAAKKKPIIMAIAKHLCGAGTDLALKALYPVRDQIQVCMMATCCHGVCTWEHYVGRDYLVSAMIEKPNYGGSNHHPSLSEFGPEEFEMLRLWSSGTVKDVSCNTSSSPKEGSDIATTATNSGEEEETHHCPDINSEGKVASVSAVVTSLQLKCGVQGLGRACQRLLDYGRKEYVDQVLFAKCDGETSNKNALIELCYYVPSTVTPQNAVLIASRQG